MHPFINILATALSSCILCEGEAWELPNWSLVLIMWVLNASRRHRMAPGHWVAQAYPDSFQGRKRSLCWGERGSESCHALPEPGQLSWGIPEDRCLRRSLYFWGRSAAINPGDHLDRDEAVPDFLSLAPTWLCQTPTPWLVYFLLWNEYWRVLERNSSVVMSKAVNSRVGCSLHCIHPWWFHSWRDP